MIRDQGLPKADLRDYENQIKRSFSVNLRAARVRRRDPARARFFFKEPSGRTARVARPLESSSRRPLARIVEPPIEPEANPTRSNRTPDEPTTQNPVDPPR
jgi:hypothetical protein